MSNFSFRRNFCTAAAILPCFASLADATVTTGTGGSGVTVGNSSLISNLDYSDTFTITADGGGNANRPFTPAIQPAAAYVIENRYGNPSVNFQSPGDPTGVGNFSFATDSQGHVTPELPVYPGTSGSGTTTGYTQTGGSTGTNTDYGIPYGLRTQYVVQADAVQSATNRIDIFSGSVAGDISQAHTLAVFFQSGGIELYNSSAGATSTGIVSGLPTAGHGTIMRLNFHKTQTRFRFT